MEEKLDDDLLIFLDKPKRFPLLDHIMLKLIIIFPRRFKVGHVMLCAIWYIMYNLKNVKNTHRGVLLLVKLRAKPATLLKVTLLHTRFPRFLNCANGTKSRNASHMIQHVRSTESTSK